MQLSQDKRERGLWKKRHFTLAYLLGETRLSFIRSTEQEPSIYFYNASGLTSLFTGQYNTEYYGAFFDKYYMKSINVSNNSIRMYIFNEHRQVNFSVQPCPPPPPLFQLIFTTQKLGGGKTESEIVQYM